MEATPRGGQKKKEAIRGRDWQEGDQKGQLTLELGPLGTSEHVWQTLLTGGPTPSKSGGRLEPLKGDISKGELEEMPTEGRTGIVPSSACPQGTLLRAPGSHPPPQIGASKAASTSLSLKWPCGTVPKHLEGKHRPGTQGSENGHR